MAYDLARESIHNALHHVLHEEDAEELVLAAQVEGVRRIDELRARQHGFYVIVDVKAAVDPGITVEEGHEIGKRLKQALIQRFGHVVVDVLVRSIPAVRRRMGSECSRWVRRGCCAIMGSG